MLPPYLWIENVPDMDGSALEDGGPKDISTIDWNLFRRDGQRANVRYRTPNAAIYSTDDDVSRSA